MAKDTEWLSLSAVLLGTNVLVGCASNVVPEDDLGVAAQALSACNDNPGKWQHLADLAVATVQEMGELNTSRQYTLVPSVHGYKVALSAYGEVVCAANGGCPGVQGYLDLQEMPNDVYVPQTLFNTVDYRLTLVNGYIQQVMQTNQLVANGRWQELPEDHSIALIGPDGTSTCGSPAYAFAARRDFHLAFSPVGPIPGHYCTQISEPAGLHGWVTSYLCSERALGMRWSYSGPIDGMTCVNVAEPTESVWSDNYLCTPEDWGLSFSHDGIPSGKQCVAFGQPFEQEGWNDNYLCWDPNSKLNHVSTLCQEFWLFGGTASCGGNNPYIDFVASQLDSSFTIDPTDYTQGGINTTTSGQCFMAMPVVSTTLDLTGACCYQSKYGYLVKYTTEPNTYYCKTS